MPLISILESSREHVLSMGIHQIVSMAGDGKLRDDNMASAELRQFLAEVPTPTLGTYITACLESGFEDSGFVLQDIVNELAQRLGYAVTPGLYRGRKGAVGFDGLWKLKGVRDIIAEVKTTDYYNISLDKMFGYRRDLVAEGKVAPDAMLLFVVGRDDSNSLEAQIRGSRYAWDARLISVESLLHLVLIKEKTQDSTTLDKIRALIEPIEYTRLDRLVDVVFHSVEDAEKSVEEELVEGEATEDPTPTRSESKRTNIRTDKDLLEAKRMEAARGLSVLTGSSMRRSRYSFFESKTGDTRACIVVSKRFVDKPSMDYWYAYHQSFHQFLGETPNGFFVLACMDKNYGFAIPYSVMQQSIDSLNKTERNGRLYWHIHLREQDGDILWYQSHAGKLTSLAPYLFMLHTS